MIAALEFLGRLTDELFEMQMRRAARRIARGRSCARTEGSVIEFIR